MNRKFIGVGLILGILMVVSLVCAADSWDSFADSEDLTATADNVSSDNSSIIPETTSNSDIDTNQSIGTTSDTKTSSKGAFSYTDNFYIALGVGGVGLLIVIILVISLVIKPHNKWKK